MFEYLFEDFDREEAIGSYDESEIVRLEQML